MYKKSRAYPFQVLARVFDDLRQSRSHAGEISPAGDEADHSQPGEHQRHDLGFRNRRHRATSFGERECKRYPELRDHATEARRACLQADETVHSVPVNQGFVPFASRPPRDEVETEDTDRTHRIVDEEQVVEGVTRNGSKPGTWRKVVDRRNFFSEEEARER